MALEARRQCEEGVGFYLLLGRKYQSARIRNPDRLFAMFAVYRPFTENDHSIL